LSDLMANPIVYIGVDECGSLTADAEFFAVAAVVTPQPDELRTLIRRVATRSGKRLNYRRKAVSEFKWRNASQHFRVEVLTHLVKSDAKLFALTIRKEGRRIEDSPENYAAIACALLKMFWDAYPNVVLSLDRHFTSPLHIALVNTAIYRHWPQQGVLTITHVDSQRNPLVQLADFAAGCVYAWHKEQDENYRLIEDKLSAAVEQWTDIKARWMREEK